LKILEIFSLEMTTSTLETLKYIRGSLQILDQLQLPFESVYEKVQNTKDGHDVIKTMKVRGAPLIAIVAMLSLAVELTTTKFTSRESVLEFIKVKLAYLLTSRPTAVNIFEASERLAKILYDSTLTNPETLCLLFIESAEEMLRKDILDNKAIGNFGSKYILKNAKSDTVRVLTHCNTGSLATAQHGTALGVIRDLHISGKLEHAYCTETRPYNQGSRLTAYELVYEKIPATLICDSMASALLKLKNIDAIVVGADRVVANGDTANKIGTYQLAITAAYHGVMFIVAAPITSIDLKTLKGDDIVIEERSGDEVTSIKGRVPGTKEIGVLDIAAPGIRVWNPAFDVVPASLITAIVTEKGVIVKSNGKDAFEVEKFIASFQ
jgi:methylthioribose-1-phosphate isomerase